MSPTMRTSYVLIISLLGVAQATLADPTSDLDIDAIRRQLNAVTAQQQRSVPSPTPDQLQQTEAELLAQLTGVSSSSPTSSAKRESPTKSEPVAELRDTRASLNEKAPAAPRVTSATARSAAQQISDTVGALERELASSREALSRARAERDRLQSELLSTRSKLLAAETELERVSISQRRSPLQPPVEKAPVSQPRAPIEKVAEAPTKPAARPATEEKLVSNRGTTRPAARAAESAASNPDLPVATVIVDKANLRSGPGNNNAPLLAVSKGSRLVVETRQGDWYRVIAPSGARAWVSSDVVAFGNALTEGSSIAIRGVSDDFKIAPRN